MSLPVCSQNRHRSLFIDEFWTNLPRENLVDRFQ